MPVLSMPALPEADRLYDRAVGHLPGGNSRTTLFVAPHPPYARAGEACHLTDVDGRRVVDLQNNYTALIHGHAHPAVTEAAVRALREGASFGLPTASEVELAELLTERVAVGDRWRFANSGTEAVMVAIRLARAVTGRDAVLRFDGCYHGSADVVIQHGARGVPAGVRHDAITVPVGDETAVLAALEEHGDRLACVIFDAMPNRAGLRPADPAFVEMLRVETARRGILLLWDEVLTFRAGPGGLQGEYGVEPDITTLGKVIGGGLPIGAIGGRAEIMDAFDPRRDDAVGHGGTFSANPVTLAAGLAAMRLFDAPAVERLNALGDGLRGQLAGQGWTVTGRGSLLRVHVPDSTALWWRLWTEGILVSVNGLLCLSTPMDDEIVATVAAAFARIAPDFDVVPDHHAAPAAAQEQ